MGKTSASSILALQINKNSTKEMKSSHHFQSLGTSLGLWSLRNGDSELHNPAELQQEGRVPQSSPGQTRKSEDCKAGIVCTDQYYRENCKGMGSSVGLLILKSWQDLSLSFHLYDRLFLHKASLRFLV